MAAGLKAAAELSVWVWVNLTVTCAAVLNLASVPVVVHLLGILALVILIRRMRMSPVGAQAVREVLGADPVEVDVDEDGLQSVRDILGQRPPDPAFCMRVVAHRGACLDAPENSLGAFRRAHERGCKAVEFDLAFTADDTAILFHDDKIDRVTDGTGYINELTWEEVQALDLTSKHPLKEKFGPEKVVLFRDAIEECVLLLGMRAIIDVKIADDRGVCAVLKAYEEYPILYKRAIVSSFSPHFIYKIRKANPNIVCAMAWRPHFMAFESYTATMGGQRARYTNIFVHLAAMVGDVVYSWAFQNFLPHFLGVSAVLLHKDVINGERALKWRSQGFRVLAWTVNQPMEKSYFGQCLHVPYITDTLDGESF